MEVGGLIHIIKELGLSAGIFGLCVWIVVYIVKNLNRDMSKLVQRLEVFTDRVRAEHEQSAKQHEAMMAEHKEMIKTLGRINGYKE